MAGDIDEKLAEARAILKKIPGVVGVGYGLKQRGGASTSELALRVYVRVKKTLSQLPSEEQIPGELFGIKTDVLVVPVVKELVVGPCENLKRYDPIIGGITISHMIEWEQGFHNGLSFGTLGCFATVDAKSGRDRVVALTNNHVLASYGGGTGDDMFQPGVKLIGQDSSGIDEYELVGGKHRIGHIENVGIREHRQYDGKPLPPGTSIEDGFFVDAGIVHIATDFSSWCHTNKGVEFGKTIADLAVPSSAPSNVVEGMAELKAADVNTTLVFKVGRATGRSVGRVQDIAGVVQDGATGDDRHHVIIVENVGPNCDGGSHFVLAGDSGSVLVNEQRKVVGLIYAGNETLGLGIACHIHPVVGAFGITIVSRENEACANSTLYEGPVELVEDRLLDPAAEAMRAEVLRSEKSRIWRELVKKHRDEVSYLVNRVRRVTVAWHRLRGPDFLAHVLEAMRFSTHRVPRAVEGVERGEALAQILALLEHNGSAALAEDILAHSANLHALIEGIDDLQALAGRMRETNEELRA